MSAATMTKTEKELEKKEGMLVRMRENVAQNKSDLTRKATGGLTGFVLGSLKKTGKLNDLPAIPGFGRIGSIAVVANVLAFVAPKGTIKRVLDGIGESSVDIAAFEWGQGHEVSGVEAYDVSGKKARLRALEQQMRELAAQDPGGAMPPPGMPGAMPANVDPYSIPTF